MSAPYIVIRCSKLQCSRFSYCKSTQKTKKCPYCGRTIRLKNVKPIPAETTLQARKMVQEFNKRLGELTEPSWYKPEQKGE